MTNTELIEAIRKLSDGDDVGSGSHLEGFTRFCDVCDLKRLVDDFEGLKQMFALAEQTYRCDN